MAKIRIQDHILMSVQNISFKLLSLLKAKPEDIKLRLSSTQILRQMANSSRQRTSIPPFRVSKPEPRGSRFIWRGFCLSSLCLCLSFSIFLLLLSTKCHTFGWRLHSLTQHISGTGIPGPAQQNVNRHVVLNSVIDSRWILWIGFSKSLKPASNCYKKPKVRYIAHTKVGRYIRWYILLSWTCMLGENGSVMRRIKKLTTETSNY